MKTKRLKNSELEISVLGLGCMGMSEYYGGREDSESIRTLHRAADLGVNFLDTADTYGVGANEELIGKAFKGRRSEIVLATKFGSMRGEDGSFLGISGRPEYVREACEASLKRLGTDHIDLYYQHRVDPNVPIEETVGAMSELVKEGKVRYLGLSEASIHQIKRAHDVHPITALQTEYSLWSREAEDELFPLCEQLGIEFVAYSPLGRGFLTGQIKRFEDLAQDDARRYLPRFTGENFQRNVDLVRHIESLAGEKGVSASQLALAWMIAQGVTPIPGTKRVKYLEENAASAEIQLTPSEMARIEEISPKGIAAGGRHREEQIPDWSAE
ncbi:MULTISPECIES: aldo/keto reductase [Saccharibacillus]|uniref:Aldo/keto reductase n=1 Tax=Saccharibacillus brassicae TaxID=2583377 RepID=A0A4Y6V4S0_SACBS|nr:MULTISPECIES: aldo/keto reductase [Saccharibacillus]MWJ30493.1 aldo/keto reductase [Saccharibacillus sp. WB 17]QDH23275.1 aldo/keto reductase [Saccharibacillus brassicae]